MSTPLPAAASDLAPHLLQKKIMYLGPHATGLISAFRLFHATVLEFENGCHSLRTVSHKFEANQNNSAQSGDLPFSVASVQRACARTEEFFQQHWELSSRPELFCRTGRGKSFSGVTSLGKGAWELVHDYLYKLGAI